MTEIQSEAVAFQQILFERLRSANTAIVRRGLLTDNLRLRVEPDLLTDHLLVGLETEVLAERLADDTETATVRIPTTWWQHFKHDAGQSRVGAWWLTTVSGQWSARRWPTRYRQEVLEVRWRRWATRPYSNIALPPASLGNPVYRETTEVLRRSTAYGASD